jgi:hypothetical protein
MRRLFRQMILPARRSSTDNATDRQESHERV